MMHKTFFTRSRALRLLLSAALLSVLPPLWAQLKITDPVAGAYLSDTYEVVLTFDRTDQVASTRLLLDQAVVGSADGWRAQWPVDFGPTIERHLLQAEVTLLDGSVVVGEALATKALRVDLASTSRVVLLNALVKDRRGRALVNLRQSDFEVRENGAPLEITGFHSRQLPLDLVLVLDTSSSLGEEGIAVVQRAAALFIQQLDAKDRVALMEIKNQPTLLSSFTQDRKQLNRAIEALHPIGQTALFDSFAEALALLAPRQRGKRAVVLFTDGRDSIYELGHQKAAQMRANVSEAQRLETVVYTIGMGDRINRDALAHMAAETGGRFLYAERGLRLPGVFEQVVQDLKHLYVLGVVPQSRKSGFHRLNVRVKKRGAQVFTRKGYALP